MGCPTNRATRRPVGATNQATERWNAQFTFGPSVGLFCYVFNLFRKTKTIRETRIMDGRIVKMLS